jgi:hypothetical protein
MVAAVHTGQGRPRSSLCTSSSSFEARHCCRSLRANTMTLREQLQRGHPARKRMLCVVISFIQLQTWWCLAVDYYLRSSPDTAESHASDVSKMLCVIMGSIAARCASALVTEQVGPSTQALPTSRVHKCFTQVFSGRRRCIRTPPCAWGPTEKQLPCCCRSTQRCTTGWSLPPAAVP